MEYQLSKKVDALVASGIRKINEQALKMERNGESVIHLELGRPDFDTPEYIKNAAIKSLEDGNVFYTSNLGMLSLRQAIANKLEKENGITYQPESEILVTVGLTEAIFGVLNTILEEGDEILIPDPVWMNYLNIPKMIGAVPVTYSLKESLDFQIDIEEIEEKITDKTKAIVIISPNNPTGSVLGKEVLNKLSDIAIKHNLMVLSDEVYERIIFDNAEHISIGSLNGMKERTITLNGFSKGYSMTGWRLGYVAAPAEIITQVNKIHQYATTCATSFVQEAGIVALRDEQDEIKLQVKEYQRRRDYLVDQLNRIPGFSCKKPKGSFYAYADVSSFEMSEEALCHKILVEGKVATVPGTIFGDSGKGYIRFSFANSFDNIVEACERIRACTEQLPKKELKL